MPKKVKLTGLKTRKWRLNVKRTPPDCAPSSSSITMGHLPEAEKTLTHFTACHLFS